MENKIIQVSCVISDDYGRMLLLHRNDDEASHWELPGGLVAREEAPEAAAVRHLGQSLGINARLTHSLGQSEPDDDADERMYQWFQAEIIGGEPSIMQPDEYDDYEYFELEDMMSLALSADSLLLIPKIVDGEVALGGSDDV